MRCEVLVLKVALVMLKDHGNHIFSENLDKSLYFGVGFITVIFQLKKSWLLHKNLIPSFLESKYGILGPIFQSGNIFGKPVYNDFLTKAHCVIYHLTQKFLRNRFIYKKKFWIQHKFSIWTLGPNAMWSFGVKGRVSYAERPWKPYIFWKFRQISLFWSRFHHCNFSIEKKLIVT